MTRRATDENSVTPPDARRLSGREDGLRATSVIAVTPVDELLAEFSATGRQQVFEEIVRRHAGMVFGVCLRTCKDAHDAEDATQAVFLALAVQCKSGNAVRHLPAWLRQVAKRTSLDVRKGRRRREAREARRRAENDGIVHEPDRPTGLDLQELGHVLSEELAKLPAKYRLPLVSLYFGGLSREEIAEQLGLKPGALGVRIHRARAMLGERLKRRGACPGGVMLSVGMMPVLDRAIGDALTLRTAEAAARVMLGYDLASAVSANVLALVNGTASAVSIGRLKVVASVILFMVTVASGGGVVVRATDTVPQVLARVRQWVAQLRAAFELPSLNLQASAANARDVENVSRPEVEAMGMALAPAPSSLPGAQPPTTDWAAGITPSTAPPPVSAVAVVTGDARSSPKPIDFPVVIYGGPSVRHQATRQEPVANATEEPADTDGSAARRPAGGGGGPAPVVASVAPRPPVASSGGDVSITSASSRSSPLLSKGAGHRPRGTIAGPTLSVGKTPGSSGVYALAGGELNVGTADVGHGGSGTFQQTGGTATVTQLRLGEGATGIGRFVQKGGHLRLSGGTPDAPAGILVGGEGKGELLLGNELAGGSITFDATDTTATLPMRPESGDCGPILVVRGAKAGSGVVRGWGRVYGPGGTLVNNGQVIADGFGHDRALTFADYTSVVNTIENGSDEPHGWFATNGGQLNLPPVQAASGTAEFTWGESAGDDTLDLVNSVRFVIQPPPDHITVSLMSTDRIDIPALPAGHDFIGVWAVDLGALRPQSVSLTVRYDDALAADRGIDEDVLKLWRYDNGAWARVTGDSVFRDVDGNLIGGDVGSLQFFAVSAPEPAGMVTLLALGSAALLRRRRRTIGISPL